MENIVEYYVRVRADGEITYDSAVYQFDTDVFCPNIEEFITVVGEQDPLV